MGAHGAPGGNTLLSCLLSLGFLSSACLNPVLGFICLFNKLFLSTFVVAGVRLIAVASEWILYCIHA